MFYVYVHHRRDDARPFYVGKGKQARAWVEQHRNPFWRAVVAKAGGYDIEFAATGLDEELALLAEMELISKLRHLGHRLTNLTDGGEGMSGFKMPSESVERRAAQLRGLVRPDISARMKGMPKSEPHRHAISVSRRGVKASPETRAKMSATRKGRPSSMRGKSHSQETIEKIRAAVSGELNPFFGKTHPPEIIERIRAVNVGRRDSQETRLRKSIAHSGEKNIHFGKPVSPERKQKQIATLKATLEGSKRPCPHCGMVASAPNLKRWHGDRCRGMI